MGLQISAIYKNRETAGAKIKHSCTIKGGKVKCNIYEVYFYSVFKFYFNLTKNTRPFIIF